MPPLAGPGPYLRLRICAALALLQPGIDPVFLVLLSDHSGLPLVDHGLVVGASQAGMAAGALAMAFVPPVGRRLLAVAAAAALLASIATVLVDGLAAILACRALFGVATGILYAGTLRAATAHTPAHAMGTVLLFQLMLATALALLLPEVALLASPALALLGLAVVPLLSLAMLVPNQQMPAVTHAPATPQRIDATTTGVFLFVAASMMVWSYVGAKGVVGGLTSEQVGIGVALGSLAGGVAALAVARGPAMLPLSAGALLASMAMLAPFLAGPGVLSFIAAMIAFNIGATYAVARYSALAIERRDAARHIVPAVQSVAMVFGPLGAAAAMGQGGFALLAAMAALTLLAAVAALLVGGQRLHIPADPDLAEKLPATGIGT